MKAITIKQPFASLIAEGMKDIENRTWPTKYRGRVLIHAAKSADYDGLPSPYAALFLLGRFHNILTIEQKESIIQLSKIRSSIVGSVEIVDCIQNHESIWAENGLWNWVLANPIKFLEPIPAKGKLSFWDYPNILSEPEEKDGPLFCHCQLPVSESNQVIKIVDHYECRYCGGIWYK